MAITNTNAAVAFSSGTASTTSETIVGSHVFRIDSFFASTKYYRIGESIKSSSFRVGGHGWYIECYHCGANDESANWVSLFLCRLQEDHDRPGSRVSGDCRFTLMESLNGGSLKRLGGHPSELVTFAARHSNGRGTNFIRRRELQSLLKDDCFQVRCVVFIEKSPPEAEQLATQTTMAGSHVLTIDGYSKIREVHGVGEAIDSLSFCVGGHHWWIQLYPSGEDEDVADGVTVNLCLNGPAAAGANNDEQLKVRFQMTLLTHARQIISSIQDFHAFTKDNNTYRAYFLDTMEHRSSPLVQAGIQIRCDIAVVKEITAVVPNLCWSTSGDHQQVPVSGDVTFDVGGHLFTAHKCVLTTRCTAFMAEFFHHQPSGKENADDVAHRVVRIHDMEPRVFKALLHFIYTDALPVEVPEDDDKVVMAQALLVAADRYGMERLKLMCGDLLCGNIDATTAVATLELADKHGCLKLKEACIKVIKDWLAKVSP